MTLWRSVKLDRDVQGSEIHYDDQLTEVYFTWKRLLQQCGRVVSAVVD